MTDGRVSALGGTARGRSAVGGLAPWCFLAPYLVVFLGFFLLPALWSAVVSLTDWKIVGTPRFVGLKNYARLFGDPLFFTALKNTLVYTVVIVPLTALVGLGLALLLNQPLRGRVATRTAVFASYVVMVSVVGIIWRLGTRSHRGGHRQLLSGETRRRGLAVAGGARDRHALHHHRDHVVDGRLQHGDVPGGPPGHPGDGARGGPHRRRQPAGRSSAT